MRRVLLALVIVASIACQKDAEEVVQPTPESQAQLAASGEESEYTLRILFSGLVALVPTDESPNPRGFWALVGNVTDPSRLPVAASRGIHTHVGRLYVSEANLMTSTEEFEPTSREPCLVQRGFNLPKQVPWRVLSLRNEDISLADNTIVSQDHLSVSRGPLSNEVVPGVFDFAANIQGLLEEILPDPGARALRAELISDAYSGDLVSARLFFDRGSVSTVKLWGQRGNPARIARFIFAGTQQSESRAIAEAVGIELSVRGPVRFQRLLRSSSTKTQLPEIIVSGSPGTLATVIVENDPSVCNDPDEDHSSPDFLFNYNLVNGPFPTQIIQRDFPLPIAAPGEEGGVDNGQCSPPRYSAPN